MKPSRVDELETTLPGTHCRLFQVNQRNGPFVTAKERKWRRFFGWTSKKCYLFVFGVHGFMKSIVYTFVRKCLQEYCQLCCCECSLQKNAALFSVRAFESVSNIRAVVKGGSSCLPCHAWKLLGSRWPIVFSSFRERLEDSLSIIWQIPYAKLLSRCSSCYLTGLLQPCFRNNSLKTTRDANYERLKSFCR